MLPKGAVELREPSSRYASEFLAATRRSRSLHAAWARPPRTQGELRDYLRRCRDGSQEGHLVFEMEGGRLVGVINLNEIVLDSFRSTSLGYYAFRPHAGRGYMTLGLAHVLRRAFGELSLHRVEANIQPGNADSLRLAKRLGFRKEGFSRRYLKLAGRWRDHERWALLAEDWQELRGTGSAW